MAEKQYPFLEFLLEDKSRYKTASEAGYVDKDNMFLIGDSGGFLMNIRPGWKFINTHLFVETADYYRKHNEYIPYKIDSLPHRQFRKREQYRRKHGFEAPCLIDPKGTIHNVRITGNHYNFLNYTRMEQLDESTIKRGKVNTAKKHYDFPKFLDAQFWFFHVLEFAENNGFHVIVDKTRRGGFSYINASTAANRVNAYSRKVVINVAIDKKYLIQRGGLSNFAINNLKFYEEKTPFKRGIYSTVNTDFRLGYKLPNGIEADNSWSSALLSVSAFNDPDCAIGKDAVEVNVEELSTMDNFDAFMEVTEPAMRTGAYTTGILKCWGTATSGDMSTFEANFYNPKAYHFMPFEDVWDTDMRGEICGYFKPYCWGLQGEIDGQYGVDKDGNSNLEVSLKIAARERMQKKESAKTYAEYINYLGQYALFPAESFSSATENIFSSEELTAWETRLRLDPDFRFYIDGQLERINGVVSFKSNVRLAKEGKKVYDYIQGVPRRGNEDPHGCVRIWFMPEYEEYFDDETKRMIKGIPKGKYSLSYDPVGVDKEKKEITDRHSHNSIAVWENPSERNGFRQKMVACYYGRPDKLEEADEIFLNLAIFYGAVGTAGVETNRGETVSNFRKWGYLKYLEHEPLFVWDPTIKGKVSTTYGYNVGGADKKLNALRLVKEMLYEEVGKKEDGSPKYAFEFILDYQTILELKKWNAEGNFDRVSQLIIRAIQWKAMQIKASYLLRTRVQLTEDNDKSSFWNREWFN